MIWNTQSHPYFGDSLYATNGTVELIIPLSYGIRIGHFSLCGQQNVFFEQPQDMTDLTTPEGWRVRGGHRLWIAPECHDVYYPDNAPITYQISGDCIRLMQEEDPWLHLRKSMDITFGDGASVKIIHRIENTGEAERICSLWALSVMAPAGVQTIPLEVYSGGSAPRHWVSMWSYTDLGDTRASYSRSEIRLTHAPLEQRYKIGVGRPNGPVTYENRGVIFEVSFPVVQDGNYPDNNVSYETFMCKHMVEMESLSPLVHLQPGATAEHTEAWCLRKTVR